MILWPSSAVTQPGPCLSGPPLTSLHSTEVDEPVCQACWTSRWVAVFPGTTAGGGLGTPGGLEARPQVAQLLRVVGGGAHSCTGRARGPAGALSGIPAGRPGRSPCVFAGRQPGRYCHRVTGVIACLFHRPPHSFYLAPAIIRPAKAGESPSRLEFPFLLLLHLGVGGGFAKEAGARAPVVARTGAMTAKGQEPLRTPGQHPPLGTATCSQGGQA